MDNTLVTGSEDVLSLQKLEDYQLANKLGGYGDWRRRDAKYASTDNAIFFDCIKLATAVKK